MIQIITTLDGVLSHILKYELIVPFQLHMKSSTNVISHKTFR
jgi:hypothetical protein